MDGDARSPDLSSSLVAPSVARRLTEEAGASLRKTKTDKREQHLHVAGPITWPHEHHALVNAIPMNASTGGQVADLASAPGINGIADVYAPFSVTDGGTGDADGLANGTVVATWQVPTSSGAIDPVSETTSPLSVGLSNGPDSALPITESMIVTTDKPDYAPGDIATFVVAGVRSGSSVTFQVADLASAPGINGIADVYAPFSSRTAAQ